MSDHCVQVLMLLVQAGALTGLVVYCVETHRMRTASQDQVKASQELLESSLSQVEGMAKPCITFWAELREGTDVILEMHGAAGNLVARLDQRSYVIHNIGNGVALDVRYYITRGDAEFDRAEGRTLRYMPYVPATAHVSLVENVNLYGGEHEATFDYHSIGGRKYRSTITLNNRVITSFKFEEIQGR